MKDKDLSNIIHEVALLNNKPDYIVKVILENIAKMVREEIQESDPEDFDSFPVIRFKVLGTLYPDKSVYNKINKIRKDGSKN